MTNPTTAGRLLDSLRAKSPELYDGVVSAASLSIERASAAMLGNLRLSLSEQLRLSEAVALVAPDFMSRALELRDQVLSARSVDSSEGVAPRRDRLSDPWAQAAELLR
jgi:hypothetical protein